MREMEIDYLHAAERINSVHNLSDSPDLLRRTSGRLYYILAKTYWREDPNDLERALSYELTGQAHSDLARKLLGGEEPWTEEEMVTICRKYRVKPLYFSEDKENQKSASDASKEPIAPVTKTNVTKVSVFGALTRNPVQGDSTLYSQTRPPSESGQFDHAKPIISRQISKGSDLSLELVP